jgi:hypothetical protein
MVGVRAQYLPLIYLKSELLVIKLLDKKEEEREFNLYVLYIKTFISQPVK